MATRTVEKSVTVASAAGNGVISLPQFSGYSLQILSIDAPPNATYTWILRDAQGYALAGAAGAVGDQTYYYNVPSLGPLSLTFSNATDGVYATKTGVEFKS